MWKKRKVRKTTKACVCAQTSGRKTTDVGGVHGKLAIATSSFLCETAIHYEHERVASHRESSQKVDGVFFFFAQCPTHIQVDYYYILMTTR